MIVIGLVVWMIDEALLVIALFSVPQRSHGAKKQATIALSSTEAEHIAATTSACQAVWLRRILCDLGQEQGGATDIFCDNNSTVMLSRNPVYHGRTKHVEIKHHFIRELIEKQEVNLKICRSEQLADVIFIRSYNLL
ncbi:retrovirus-related pol polyprotein from transposon TNT 1-94 [Tanacetum coccineum]